MSKTYGQILKDVLTDDPEIGRLLFVPDESFDRCARAVILEFVRQVEEEKDAWMDEVYYDDEQTKFENHITALGKAFRKLSTELKEAK